MSEQNLVRILIMAMMVAAIVSTVYLLNGYNGFIVFIVSSVIGAASVMIARSVK